MKQYMMHAQTQSKKLTAIYQAIITKLLLLLIQQILNIY
jgi:hypothetical protein